MNLISLLVIFIQGHKLIGKCAVKGTDHNNSWKVYVS